MSRVERRADGEPLEVPEAPRCFWCGAEEQRGECSARCDSSRRVDQARRQERMDRAPTETQTGEPPAGWRIA